MAPIGAASFIINKCGSYTPGNEITPKMPGVMPKHSISPTDDRSQPEYIELNYY